MRLLLSICLTAATACMALAALASQSGTSTVRVHVYRFVDQPRTIRLPDGRRMARTLVTVVRSPTAAGRYPLIVFGHGFALTPATYSRLLRRWATAGYVVAAPAFPLGNANAPGGPNEADIVNQPRDLSFVITRLLIALRGTIDPARIAVAGHSDGAVAALAAAYDTRYRDRRIAAAIILSGAALPGMAQFPSGGPPLLAMQGTADPINAPSTTSAYFARARRPKFLLWLEGASHRPPYTDEEPQLAIVERVTIAFLNHYLKDRPLRALTTAARPQTLARLVADP
jgi:pimeloyl-ACP methyl ester carboxylesterase